jgi:hypothetical protein
MTKLFTDEDTWKGGYYELAIEIGARSDDRLLAALTAVWTHMSLTGCYLDRDREPGEQAQVEITEDSLKVAHLQGMARLPNDYIVACGTCLIREDNGPDWLMFYIPMGALGPAYDIGAYPFDDDVRDSRNWRRPVDNWLSALGFWVYDRVRFKLGLIGHEVSGDLYAQDVELNGVPEQRSAGLLWAGDTGLRYYPSTI